MQRRERIHCMYMIKSETETETMRKLVTIRTERGGDVFQSRINIRSVSSHVRNMHTRHLPTNTSHMHAKQATLHMTFDAIERSL